ncbi:MAG TPA: choline-binding protein A, partial [Candidatus Faecivivens stercoravium]|nr:choline-binding protein A [Candidatus Faecivivens stercoravium]
ADGFHEYSMGTMLYLDGKRVKGLYEYEGALYYFDESGFMQTGWVELPDGWYYFGADGKMATGWLQIGNVWYYLEPKTGRMVDNGLHTVGRTTYYFYDWGGMASDWWYEDENGDWYFFGGSGAMKAAQWVEWKGEWYYLTETGKMAADADIGGYYVNAEGAWVE